MSYYFRQKISLLKINVKSLSGLSSIESSIFVLSHGVPVHLQAIKFTDGEHIQTMKSFIIIQCYTRQDGQKIKIPLRRVFHSIIIIKIHDSIDSIILHIKNLTPRNC